MSVNGVLLVSDVTGAVETTLAPAYGIVRTFSEETLPEGINDLPSLVVYGVGGQGDSRSRNDRSSFGAGIRVADMTVNVDAYVRQRSHIGEDIARVSDITDAVYAILEAQRRQPYFGLPGLKGFQWTWSRVTFVYGDPETKYAGVQFVLNFWIF